jgi:hypothetical protein
MALTFYSNDPCPKCRWPVMHAVIGAHPNLRDVALQNFYCAKCGPIRTEILSLRPPKTTRCPSQPNESSSSSPSAAFLSQKAARNCGKRSEQASAVFNSGATERAHIS